MYRFLQNLVLKGHDKQVKRDVLDSVLSGIHKLEIDGFLTASRLESLIESLR